MHGLWNTRMMTVGLWTLLACEVDADDRMVRRHAGCLADPTTTLHRLSVPSAGGTVALRAEAAEEQLRGQLECHRGHHQKDHGRLGPLL